MPKKRLQCQIIATIDPVIVKKLDKYATILIDVSLLKTTNFSNSDLIKQKLLTQFSNNLEFYDLLILLLDSPLLHQVTVIRFNIVSALIDLDGILDNPKKSLDSLILIFTKTFSKFIEANETLLGLIVKLKTLVMCLQCKIFIYHFLKNYLLLNTYSLNN